MTGSRTGRLSGHLTWLGDRRTAVLELVALVAVGLVPVLSRGTDWLGSWKMALDAGTFSLTLIGPVAAGIACATYVRFATSGVEPLVRTGPRPWWPWLRPALTIGGLAAVAMLGITLAVTTAARLAGAVPYYDTVWVVVPALCVLGAQVSVGVLLGGVGRRVWLAPVAAAVTFSLGILGAVGVMPEIFRIGGLGVSYAGETFDAATLGLQSGAALGIASALLVLSNRRVVAATSTARAAVSVLVLLGAVCYAVLGNGYHDRYRTVSDPELVCRGDSVRVCMARETTRPLDDLVERMERLAGPLRELGLELPARYVQPQVARDLTEADGGLHLVGQELEATVSDESAAASLATPARCAAYSADIAPPEAAFDARRLLARWLLLRAGLLQPRTDDYDREWLESGLDAQRPWVTTTYEQLRSCDVEALRLPAGV
jgi:hypothetical protein